MSAALEIAWTNLWWLTGRWRSVSASGLFFRWCIYFTYSYTSNYFSKESTEHSLWRYALDFALLWNDGISYQYSASLPKPANPTIRCHFDTPFETLLHFHCRFSIYWFASWNPNFFWAPRSLFWICYLGSGCLGLVGVRVWTVTRD